ncbi:MAG TPA: enhanced serine sensitivity protein SseB C-terminal domain-containing protein [Pyrinomonadaceae bacterium]|nr:enhanced serine sensitivity protein SseB C-terminal domain-containing protein [Pyrinomonadaceae bacterium]
MWSDEALIARVLPTAIFVLLMATVVIGVQESKDKMTPLDKALQAAQSDRSRTNDFYNLFLATDLYVPTHDASKVESGSRRATEGETFSPVIVTNKGTNFLPIFDTLERLQAWAAGHELTYVRMPAHALVGSIDSRLHLALNVGTDHFKEFATEEVKWLQNSVLATGTQQSVPAGTEVLVGTPAKIPNGLEGALTRCLNRNKEIKAGYLGQVIYARQGEKSHLVLVLQVEPVDEAVFAAIAHDAGVTARGILGAGEYLDIMRDDGRGIAATIVRQVKPFYVASN